MSRVFLWLLWGSCAVAQVADPSVCTFVGSPWNRNLGACLQVADVNGDGALDIITTAPYGDAPGRPWAGFLYMLFGSQGISQSLSNPKRWEDLSLRVLGGQDHGSIGMSLAVGDFNGDGVADVATGAPFAGKGRAGMVYVFWGKAGLTAGDWDLKNRSPDLEIVGGLDNMMLGKAMARGDVDGDGVDDLAVTASGYSVRAGGYGCVFIFLGQTLKGKTRLDTATEPVDRMVHSYRAASPDIETLAMGDSDGDGIDSLIIGLPESGADGQKGAGFVLGVSCSNSTPVVDVGQAGPDWKMEAAPGAKGFGLSLLSYDVDSDQSGEVLIGARDSQQAKSMAGAVFLVDLGTPAVLMGNLCVGDAYDAMGASLAVGDLDGNGLDDLAIGAPGSDAGKKDGGAVYVLWDLADKVTQAQGRISPMEIDVIMTANETYANMGNAVAVGDVNRDGADDILTGSPGDAPEGRKDAGTVAMLLQPTGGGALARRVEPAVPPAVGRIGRISTPSSTLVRLAVPVLIGVGIFFAVMLLKRKLSSSASVQKAETLVQVLVDRGKNLATVASGTMPGSRSFSLQMAKVGVGGKGEHAQEHLKKGSRLLSEGQGEEATRELEKASEVDPLQAQTAAADLVLENATRLRVEVDARRGSLSVKCWPAPKGAPPLAITMTLEAEQPARQAEFARVSGEEYWLAEFEDVPSGQFGLGLKA